MSHKLVDLNRLDPEVFSNLIEEVLPEYFPEDNGKFITLLKEYYEWMDSDASHNFNETINQSIRARDIRSADTIYLDQIIGEIGNGLTQSSFFDNPRLMGRLLADYYRVKGTKIGTERFFKAFFNETALIEYPKENIFTVGEDKIGYESIRFIQDNKQYQVFSILIKLGLNVNDYEALYKKFAHPAGFHFTGVVQTQTRTDLGLEVTSVDFTDSAETTADILKVVGETNIGLSSTFEPMTAIIEDSAGTVFRSALTEKITEYQNLTISDLENFYGDLKTFVNPNSFTFDDSSAKPRPDISMTFETMDNDFFTRSGSDSVYWYK